MRQTMLASLAPTPTVQYLNPIICARFARTTPKRTNAKRTTPGGGMGEPRFPQKVEKRKPYKNISIYIYNIYTIKHDNPTRLSSQNKST